MDQSKVQITELQKEALDVQEKIEDLSQQHEIIQSVLNRLVHHLEQIEATPAPELTPRTYEEYMGRLVRGSFRPINRLHPAKVKKAAQHSPVHQESVLKIGMLGP